MDFAYVPVGSASDNGIKSARKFYAYGASAPVAVPSSTVSLKSILEWIDVRLPTADSIGTAYVVSHASTEHISIPMTPNGGTQTTYENLVDLIGAVPRFIAPPSFRTTPGPTLAIKGCRIGVNQAFLLLLKQHLGGTATVRAPRHFNRFHYKESKLQDVALDSLSYNLEIHRKARIASHADLVTQFVQEPFKRYDGSSVPAADLKALLNQLPKADKLAKAYLPGPKSSGQVKLPLAGKIRFNESVSGLTTWATKTHAEFRSQRVVAVVKGVNDADFAAKPLPDHVEDAIDEWDLKYKNATAVPVSFSESIGLRADEDPVDINWISFSAVDKVTKAKGRKIAGVYYRYQLIFPITSVVDGTLLFDSRVGKGPALATPTTWPTDPAHLAALFRTV